MLALGVARPALADEAADAEARQHYKAATGHFAVGEFAQAAAEYEASFKLHQDPALLFNAAQSRRLAGDNQKALVLYKNYLQLYPSNKNVPAVRDQISKLQDAIAADDKAKNSPPTNTVEPHGVVGEPTPPPPSTTTPPPPAATTPPATSEPAPMARSDEKPPIWKKLWFWTGIGVVVVAAVVIPVAVVLSQPQWNNLPDQGPGAKASRVTPSVSPMLEVRW
jgi:tetratricopeptide (TPR) repeat protein